MTLNFKLKSWEAETHVAIATITKTYSEPPFIWEIYSKPDQATITGGEASSLDHAKRQCLYAARGIE